MTIYMLNKVCFKNDPDDDALTIAQAARIDQKDIMTNSMAY